MRTEKRIGKPEAWGRTPETVMIVSVSRRTDIPAYYAEWFIRRLRAGWCEVANPFRPSSVTRVSLDRADVDAFVFWTRNPAPFAAATDEVEARGYPFYFLVTVNGYPPELEPHAPPLPVRLAALRRLADRIGPDRVVWRYDPILLSERMDFGWHLDRFTELAAALRDATRRVIVSFADFYRKTERRLRAVERLTGDPFVRDPFAQPGFPTFVRRLCTRAAEQGMDIQSCAEDARLASLGIRPGKCIDDELLRRVLGVSVRDRKDAGQRPACGCVAARDIGAVDSCPNGCEYCYATVSHAVARDRHARHDPANPLLIPPVQGAGRRNGDARVG
jgi:hypothetical protein